jgi:hypothetical protein
LAIHSEAPLLIGSTMAGVLLNPRASGQVCILHIGTLAAVVVHNHCIVVEIGLGKVPDLSLFLLAGQLPDKHAIGRAITRRRETLAATTVYKPIAIWTLRYGQRGR